MPQVELTNIFSLIAQYPKDTDTYVHILKKKEQNIISRQVNTVDQSEVKEMGVKQKASE